MTAAGLAERLHGRRSGAGWLARCPSHEDSNPSLSITERDGKVLVHCHAGCEPDAIVAALGLTMRDLFEDSTEPASREVASYDYRDETGSLLFQVVRYEPKAFKQRRPDGNDGWVWNLDGVRRVPYNLPEVLSAKSGLVCEGEKDCKAARRLGLVGTTNPGGAGKWRPEYSEFLRDKRVAVIADSDEAGRRHAQQVAESLHGKAASVKVLELPASKDLSEWVERGGTREQLDALIAGAPEWTPGTENGSRIVLVSAAEFLGRKTDGERDWLAEGILPAKSQTIWQGRPKVGKSHTLLQLAFDLACGLPVFGRFQTGRERSVAYVELEEPEGTTKQRFAGMIRAHDGRGPDAQRLAFFTTHDLFAGRLLARELLGARRGEFAAALRDRGVGLIILIALRRLASGDRNDPQMAEVLNDALDELAGQTGAAIALANHDRKAPAETAEAQGLGSTMFSARADAVFDLSRAADGLRLVRAEARFDAPDQFYLAKASRGEGELVVWAEAPADPKAAKREAVLHRVAAGQSIHAAAQAEAVPYQSAQRWVAGARGSDGGPLAHPPME